MSSEAVDREMGLAVHGFTPSIVLMCGKAVLPLTVTGRVQVILRRLLTVMEELIKDMCASAAAYNTMLAPLPLYVRHYSQCARRDLLVACVTKIAIKYCGSRDPELIKQVRLARTIVVVMRTDSGEGAPCEQLIYPRLLIVSRCY